MVPDSDCNMLSCSSRASRTRSAAAAAGLELAGQPHLLQHRADPSRGCFRDEQGAATTIVDLAATMGMDFLVIGASQRPALVKLLRGSVATNVAQQLPESIHMIIYG